jgi:hypothetical protein
LLAIPTLDAHKETPNTKNPMRNKNKLTQDKDSTFWLGGNVDLGFLFHPTKKFKNEWREGRVIESLKVNNGKSKWI